MIGQALLQSGNGFLQSCQFHWFDQIVERPAFKRLHGVFAECGDEHQMRLLANLACGINAIDTGHLHVEKTDFRPMLVECR